MLTLAAQLYTHVPAFQRLPNAKSTSTLITLSDPLSAILTHAAVVAEDAAPDILRAGCDMIDAGWAWAQRSSDMGGEQRVGRELAVKPR